MNTELPHVALGDSTSINVNSIYFYVANYMKMQDALLSLTYSETFPWFITGKYMLSEQKVSYLMLTLSYLVL